MAWIFSRQMSLRPIHRRLVVTPKCGDCKGNVPQKGHLIQVTIGSDFLVFFLVIWKEVVMFFIGGVLLGRSRSLDGNHRSGV